MRHAPLTRPLHINSTYALSHRVLNSAAAASASSTNRDTHPIAAAPGTAHEAAVWTAQSRQLSPAAIMRETSFQRWSCSTSLCGADRVSLRAPDSFTYSLYLLVFSIKGSKNPSALRAPDFLQFVCVLLVISIKWFNLSGALRAPDLFRFHLHFISATMIKFIIKFVTKFMIKFMINAKHIFKLH